MKQKNSIGPIEYIPDEEKSDSTDNTDSTDEEIQIDSTDNTDLPVEESPIEEDDNISDDSINVDDSLDGDSNNQNNIEQENNPSNVESGNAKFSKIRPHQKVTVKDLRDYVRDNVVQEGSSYLVVETRELSDDEWNDYTENLNQPHDWFTGFTDTDRKNYTFNVIKFTNQNANYSLLVDPTRLQLR